MKRRHTRNSIRHRVTGLTYEINKTRKRSDQIQTEFSPPYAVSKVIFTCSRNRNPKSPYYETFKIPSSRHPLTYFAVSPGNRFPLTANIFPVVAETKPST